MNVEVTPLPGIVLLMAIIGPIAARVVEPVGEFFLRRRATAR